MNCVEYFKKEKDTKLVYIIVISFLFSFKIQAQNLVELARTGDLEKIKLAIESGADINQREQIGGTALNSASYNGHTEVVRYLLEKKADIESIDPSDGGTALIASAMEGHTEIVKLLLQNHANVNAQDRIGYTALMFAVSGKEEIVNLLLNAGADVNKVNRYNITALMYSLEGLDRKITIVERLLKAKANVNVRDQWGKTALSRAKDRAETEMVKLLVKAGAK
jgi:ankyrin repeat protein